MAEFHTKHQNNGWLAREASRDLLRARKNRTPQQEAELNFLERLLNEKPPGPRDVGGRG